MIYRVSRIPIPTPEFYVFYNGTAEQPDEQMLKLSDAYIEKTADPMLELKVKMININPSVKHPILDECRPLYEYSAFIQAIRDYMESVETRDKAIEKGMADFVRDGIMVDFIEEHGSEVRNMLFTEFNLEDALEVRGEERYEEGLAKGLAAGLSTGVEKGVLSSEIRTIRGMLKKNLSIGKISELLELEAPYVARIAELLNQYPDESDLSLADRILSEFHSPRFPLY